MATRDPAVPSRAAGVVSPARALSVVFAASLVLIAAVVWPMWKPLLLAAVVAGALSRWHDRLASAFKGRRTISATLMTLAVILVVLIPIAASVLLATKQILQLAQTVRHLSGHEAAASVLRQLPDWIAEWVSRRYGDVLAHPGQLWARLEHFARSGWALSTLGGLIGSISGLLLATAMLLIAFFFLLRDGHGLVDWFRDAGLIPRADVDRLLQEFRETAKSVIGGNLLAGLAQAVVATIGYAISPLPSPFLLGLGTFFASFVPSVGVVVVGLPAAGLLLLLGHPWWALFLAGWIFVPVGLTDNVLRPLLMRGGSHLPGALVFFALMGGLLLFGAMGLVVGPLALVFFLVMARSVGKRP
ncbi:MAG TPA: AI-2E family transporter [Polyangia bacterium]